MSEGGDHLVLTTHPAEFHPADSDYLLCVLSRHIGASRAVRVGELAREAGYSERVVRRLVSELREDGYAICAHPAQGYYMAETAEELERTCAFLRARAMHSLVLESRLRQIPLPDLLGQLHLET